MTMTLAQFHEEYDLSITNKITDRLLAKPRAYEGYFNMDPNGAGASHFEVLKSIIWSSLEQMAQWPDATATPISSPVKRFERSTTMLHYGQGIEVSRLHKSYGDIAQILRWAGSLGDSCITSINAAAAAILNGAFATVTTSETGTVYLASASHLTAGSTQSNLVGAAALSPTTVSAMRLSMAGRVDYMGKRNPEQLMLLVVPPALADTAKEITGSNLKPYTTDNQINVHQGLQYLVEPYLTSSTAFFGLAEEHFLNGYVGQAPAQDQYDDNATQSAVYRIQADFVFDALDWLGFAACAGA